MVKTILITDATDGIGKHLAKKLASEGHQVILHGRNHQKLELALQEVRAVSLRGRVFSYLADFSKLEDVYRFVEEIKRDFQRVDVLFNNAGLYAGKERKASAENVELTFMLSVLVPYMLTTELSPLLEKAADGRVINTSSYMHHFAKVKDLDFGFEKEYNPGLAYNNSKLYTIWMTRYLARDFFLKSSNITINAYHPGLISTNLGNNSSDEKTKKSLFGRLMKSLSKNLDQGIETGYYLTLSEEVRGLTGYYFDEKKVKSVSEKGYTFEKARKLMDYCQEKVKMFKEKQDF
ncbi:MULTISPECIES: SDR family NAD(P)-dependent oxidoreductase [Streptococcus]|jgi:oxidoreductase, short chain dehydrogenase/reductase family|uniref:SDR family NAD(P)-dependent oxidoreductase n=1 Tax=Streptococcus salivarius TaxID=1304 RepID=A0A6A8UBW7_STRSL|nr:MULTISPECIES: SDR family NAD(P)-dependent oxidoreductase [Streptococcus]MTQ88998.1 SDR family NAD(P)-dependent oxidoreductase [Streptococcus salivarius]MTR27175.1 SDR family NAD(P)-dependent oxidoreductase [Streptococcus salivarius]MTR38601.1 SDR family NAD(P)-dependent oxidoreductase [Streptococcus salivarius]